MKKRLNRSELSAVAQMISTKVQASFNNKVKGIVKKDPDFKKLEKIGDELTELNEKVSIKNKEWNMVQDKLGSKFKDLNMNIGFFRDHKNEVNINVYLGSMYNDVYTDLVLLNIKDSNIEDAVNSLIEKYSKM